MENHFYINPQAKVRIFISGMPGVGKTTLLLKLASEFPGCGFYTPEVRIGNKRVAFLCRSFDGKEIVLAKKLGGKWKIFSADFESFLKQIRICFPMYIDEIGRMEFEAPFFKTFLQQAMETEVFLATLHRKYMDHFKRYGKIYWLTKENRNAIYEEIRQTISGALQTFKNSFPHRI